MQLYKKLSRENKQLPRNQRLRDPDYSLRDWLELIAEGLMFPQTISPIGKRVMDAPYIAGISQGRHEEGATAAHGLLEEATRDHRRSDFVRK